MLNSLALLSHRRLSISLHIKNLIEKWNFFIYFSNKRKNRSRILKGEPMDILEKLDKKENILKVAQNLFARFGLLKTTIDDIARKARMGQASIYYYFKSKESIYKEVIDKEGLVLQERILSAVNAE